MTEAKLKKLKAVLFDLDGVLIDSMPYHVAAWQKVLASLGMNIPGEILRRSEGEKAKITIKRLAKEHGLEFSDQRLEELVEKKRRIYRQNAPRGLRPLARSTVDLCHLRGLKTAIVTGSVRPNLEWTLSAEERNLFDLILSSEYYHQGKPHPEPYLNAARQLDLRPEECLVVENAPLGIRSAKAAGMLCVAVTTTLPQEELKEADWIIADLDQLKDLLDHDDSMIKKGG